MRIEFKDATVPSKEEILKQAEGQKRVVLAGKEPLKRTGIIDIVRKLQNEEILIETDGQELSAMAEKLK